MVLYSWPNLSVGPGRSRLRGGCSSHTPYSSGICGRRGSCGRSMGCVRRKRRGDWAGPRAVLRRPNPAPFPVNIVCVSCGRSVVPIPLVYYCMVGPDGSQWLSCGFCSDFADLVSMWCHACIACALCSRMLAFPPLRFCFTVGGSVWSPCIFEGLCSSFSVCIKSGRGGGQAGSRVTVRSPWPLQFLADGACVRGIGSAITCRHGVTGVRVGLRCFRLFFLPGPFWVPGCFWGCLAQCL